MRLAAGQGVVMEVVYHERAAVRGQVDVEFQQERYNRIWCGGFR